MTYSIKIRRAIFAIMCAIVIWLGVERCSERHMSDVYVLGYQSTALIRGLVGYGTGFLVLDKNDRPIFITNSHVCWMASMNLMTIMFNTKTNYFISLKVIKESPTWDLCALAVKDGELPAYMEPLTIADTELNTGDKVYLMGYPQTSLLTVTQGEYIGSEDFAVPVQPIVCKGDKFIRFNDLTCLLVGIADFLTAQSDAGGSGSPVLNDQLEVVGVAFMTRGNASMASSVPLPALRAFIDSL